MSILQSDNLSFDFRYTGFSAGWVQYQFYFLWNGEPIIRDELLKKHSSYWASRPNGAFLARDYEYDGLLPLLKKVLETDKADYWESLDPDIVVALYPDDYFPFLPSHWKLIRENETLKAKREEREKLKQEKIKLPDDSYTFIAFVDAYNLKDADTYYGQGLSLQMIVERRDLEKFVSDLEKEYEAFKIQFNVDAYREGECETIEVDNITPELLSALQNSQQTQ